VKFIIEIEYFYFKCEEGLSFMKLSEVKDLIELGLILIAGVFSILGIQGNDSMVQVALLIILGAALLIVGVYKIYTKIKNSYREVRSMSNINVIRKSKQHCKSLYKFAKTNRKKLENNKMISVMKKKRVEENKIIDILSGKIEDEKKKEELSNRIIKLKKDYSDKNTVLLMKGLTEHQDYKIAMLISDTFMKLERMLLNAEQYELRIKFGRFILDFSDKELDKQKACIDFLGWTYLMMGEVNKGEKAILKGVARAKYIVENSEDKKIISSSYFNLARAYRHLGSARHTYENYPEKAIENLREAEEYFNKINKVDFNNDKKLQEMITGIKYGQAIACMFLFKEKLDKNLQTDQDYLKVLKTYEDLDVLAKDSKGFDNKHRYVKVELLRTKFLELFIDYNQYFVASLGDKMKIIKEDALVEMKNSLKEVDDIFRLNIFTDEAVELFLEQSVKELKYNLVKELQGAI
jgi:tetratricopeptide (TPR) repeat protein